MSAIDNTKKSARFLQSRRYTHDTYTDAQEAFTSVLDINADEIYIDQGLIPSSGLPYNSSGNHLSVYSASGQQVMKYYYRYKMTKSDLNNEAWFFLVPTGSTSGIGAQIIDAGQQTNFISPKYAVPSLANANTEDATPGYGVKVFVSTNATTPASGDQVSVNNYTFDYKTGVLQFTTSAVAPSGVQYVYITAYQYVGRKLSSQITNGGTIYDILKPTGSIYSTTNDLVVTGSLIVTEGFTGSLDYGNLINVPTLVSGSEQVVADFTFTTDTITNTAITLHATDSDIVLNADGGVYIGSANSGNGVVTDGLLNLIIGDGDLINTGTGHSITDNLANITGAFNSFTSSYTTGSFTGSFIGNGGGLYNVPASGVTGLNLSQIADGSATASISNTEGLRVNRSTEITGSLIVTSGSAIFNSQVTAEGSDLVLTSGSNFILQDNGLVDITGSVTIKGNLRVEGTTTLVQTVDPNIESLIVSGAMNIVKNEISGQIVSASLAIQNIKTIEYINPNVVIDLGGF